MTGIVTGPVPPIPYISGNYFQPVIGNGATTAVSVVGHIGIMPFVVRAPVIVTRAGIRIITAVAASNLQLALYANNPATFRPTGNALATTASITGAVAATVDAALTANVQLLPGLIYWAGCNQDSAGLAYTGLSPSNSTISNLQGTATLSEALGAVNVNLGGLDVTQAFNTWPDLTSASFTWTSSNVQAIPVPILKAA